MIVQKVELNADFIGANVIGYMGLAGWLTLSRFVMRFQFLTKRNSVSERNLPMSAAVMNMRGMPTSAKITENILPVSVSTDTSP